MSRRKIAELKFFERGSDGLFPFNAVFQHGVGAAVIEPDGSLTVMFPNPVGNPSLGGVGKERWDPESLTAIGSILVDGGMESEWHGWLEDGWLCE